MWNILNKYIKILTLALIVYLFVPLRCESDVDECSTTPGVCQNGGVCQNFNGTYNCSCPDLFGGDNCEVVVSCTVIEPVHEKKVLTVLILSFRTDRSEQTVRTQIRLLL